MAKNRRTITPISSKPLRQRAEELVRTSPTDIAGMTSNEVQRLIHELQIHQIELELHNEGLHQAHVELAQSRYQYSDLYELAPTGYVTLDSDGKIQNANLTTATMLGVERQHLLQAKLSNFVNRQSQDEFYLHRQAVFSSETKQSCELRMQGADARGLAVRLESMAFGPENDRRCRTALIDLTAERQAEQLQESEQRYRRLTDAVTNYIYRVRVEHGRSVETTHGANCEALTGYTPEEFEGNRKLWIAMVPPKDRGLVERQVACILSGQEAPPIEYRIRRKDGSIKWVLNVVSPERDDQGHLIAYDGLLRDITNRRMAEETLRLINIDLGKSLANRTGELEQNIKMVKLLTEAVSHLGEGLLITSNDLDWPGPHIVFLNNAMSQITGYTAEELIGHSPRILQGSGSNREALNRIKVELSAGRSAFAEVINYRKDVTPYDAELFITPLYNADGHRTNFVSIHRDITCRRQAEEDLRASEEQSQAILTSLPAHIAVIDRRGTVTAVNPAWEAFALANGGSLERCSVGVNYLDACRAATGEEGVKVAEQLRAILDGADTLFTMEYPCHSGAQQRWFLLQAVPLRHDKGGAVVTHTNITDRIIDISLKTGHGIDLVKQVHARRPKMKMLVNSMYDESVYAERALQAGAMGYLSKQCVSETLIGAIRTVLAGKIYLSPMMTDRILKRRVGVTIQSGNSPIESLSNRELEVLTLIGQGNTTGGIAEQLYISTHTIDTYREKLKIKLNLANGAELNRYAVQWVLENG